MNCTKCGNAMAFRSGRFGNFWGCTNYPNCKNTIAVKGSGKILVKKEVEQPDSIALVAGSDQQEKLWDYIRNGSGHAVVHACPGTGKTFSLVQGTARCDLKNQSVVYFAFNNSIRDEMLEKAPKGVTVLGLNQFGHRICTKAFKTRLDDNKYYKLFNELFPAESADQNKMQYYCALKAKELVSLCQSYMVDGTNEEELSDIIQRHEIRMPKDNSSKIISAIPKLLEEGKKRTGTITFSDQLWLPVVLDLPTPQFDLITIDEAQDLNKVQHLLVVRSMHKNSRVIVVGDENQAIYAFRGADTDSMASMAFMLEVTGKDVEHFPLTKTWRCGKKIVELAKEYVPEIEAHENNPEGDVISGMLSDVEDQFLPGDMVLCRMNGPLVTLGYRLMKQGKKVHFQGKKFGEELVGIAQGLDADSINDLLIKLSSYEDGRLDKLAEKEKIGGNVKMQKIDLQDRMDCLRAFLIGLPEDMPINEVLSKMEKFFCDSQDEKDSITLTSIHRAKGRERDRVFYFKPEISFDGLSEEDERQERNLKFVAITRAKKFLCMVTANDE